MKKLIGLLLGLSLAPLARAQSIADYAQLLSNFAVRLDGGSSVSSGIVGGTCTNQVMTAIDTTGLPTCASVTGAMIAATTIDLTTKVTGTLPVTNGGTGLAAVSADQTPVGTAANTYTAKALPLCTDTGGNHLNYDTSTHTFSCGTSGDGSGAPDPGTALYTTEDFLAPRSSATSTCASSGGGMGLVVTNTGGTSPGNINPVASTVNHPGICQWETGTSAAAGTTDLGTGGGSTGDRAFIFGSSTETLEWETCVTALSDATNTYAVRMGYGDTNAGTTFVDGCWFEYTDSVNSGKWVGTCSNNSVTTSTNTTVAPTVCPTFQKLKITGTSSSMTFSTDGTNSAGGAVTTNIPTAAGRETGAHWTIKKTGGAGTTSVGFQLDYIKLNWLLTR